MTQDDRCLISTLLRDTRLSLLVADLDRLDDVYDGGYGMWDQWQEAVWTLIFHIAHGRRFELPVDLNELHTDDEAVARRVLADHIARGEAA